NPDVIGDIDDGVVFAANCTTPEPPSSEAMSSCLGAYLNSEVTGEWVGDTLSDSVSCASDRLAEGRPDDPAAAARSNRLDVSSGDSAA
ncbi:hypothetical protein PFISCL1PPCAC_9185, partial [Pristionchus fissidentatus]